MIDHISGEVSQYGSNLNFVRTRFPQRAWNETPSSLIAIDFDSAFNSISRRIKHAKLALQQRVIHRFRKLDGDCVCRTGFCGHDLPGAFIQSLPVRRTNGEWFFEIRL